MLEAFAGPPNPVPVVAQGKRRASRRTVILVVAGLLALGLSIPGALALLGQWETPKQFLADRSQPRYAKQWIQHWLKFKGVQFFRIGGLRPVSVELKTLANVLTAHTPDGDVRVYAVRLTRGWRGISVISSSARGPRIMVLFPVGRGLPFPGNAAPGQVLICPRGWVVQYVDGGPYTLGRGRAVGYILGRASTRVASVHVRYEDGGKTQGTVENGYFLAWLKPNSGKGLSTLIAKDATGKTVGRFFLVGDGLSAVMPGKSLGPFSKRPFSCVS
jgi:hypothetical protein